MALSDLKRCWLWQSDDSAFFIEDRTKIWMFVFKITGVNMHTTQALLTLLNNVQGLSFRLKSCSFRFFSFSLLLVKIIHFLTARRRSHSQRRRFVEPAAGPFWEGWMVISCCGIVTVDSRFTVFKDTVGRCHVSGSWAQQWFLPVMITRYVCGIWIHSKHYKPTPIT